MIYLVCTHYCCDSIIIIKVGAKFISNRGYYFLWLLHVSSATLKQEICDQAAVRKGTIREDGSMTSFNMNMSNLLSTNVVVHEYTRYKQSGLHVQYITPYTLQAT